MKNSNNNAVDTSENLSKITVCCRSIVLQGIALAEKRYPSVMLGSQDRELYLERMTHKIVALLKNYPIEMVDARDQKLFTLISDVVSDMFTAKRDGLKKKLVPAYEENLEAALYGILKQHYPVDVSSHTFPTLLTPAKTGDFFENVASGDKEAVLKEIHRHPQLLWEKNKQGETALYMAAAAGDKEMMQLLTEHGAHHYELAKHGQTTLHWLVRKGRNQQDGQTLLFLLENGVHPAIHTPATSSHSASITPLQGRKGYGPHLSPEVLSAFLTHGVRPKQDIADESHTGIENLLSMWRYLDNAFEIGNKEPHFLYAPIKTWKDFFERPFMRSGSLSSVEWSEWKKLLTLCVSTPHLRAELAEEMDPAAVEIALRHIGKQRESTPLEQREEFFEALLGGDKQTVMSLLQAYPTLYRAIDNNGRYAIHLACEGGNIAIVELLLKYGADLLQPTLQGGMAPLQMAAQYGHNALLSYLLDRGVNIHAVSKGPSESNALYTAIKFRNFSTAALLFERGAILAPQMQQTLAPLVFLAKHGQQALIKTCLSKGMDINAPDANGVTPLHAAIAEGNFSLVQFLVKNNADVNSTDHSKETPLSLATKGGHAAIAVYLLEHGADKKTAESLGLPLYVAIAKGRIDDVQKLLPHVPLEQRKRAFVAAVKSENPAMIDLLLYQWGAKVQELFSEHRILLEREIVEGSLTLFTFEPFKKQLDKPMRNHLLLYAAERGRTGIVQWLIKEGVDLIPESDLGENVFEVAARCGNISTLKLLYNDETTRKAANWEKVMEVAIEHNQLQAVKLLHAYGIDNAFFLKSACAVKRKDIARFFLQQGAEVVLHYSAFHSAYGESVDALDMDGIDASNLPLIGVTEEKLARFENPEKAITSFSGLFAVVQAPKEGTTLSEWKGWITALQIALSMEATKRDMVQEGLDPAAVKETVGKAKAMANMLERMTEQQKDLHSLGKKPHPLNAMLPELRMHIVGYAHNGKLSSYVVEQLESYLTHTLKKDRSIADLVPKMFVWSREELKHQPITAPKTAENVVEKQPQATFASKVPSAKADFSRYSNLVINEPAAEKAKLHKQWVKIGIKADKAAHATHGSDEEKLAAWNAVWEEKDSDQACRKRFGLPNNPYKPRTGNAEEQLERDIRSNKGITKEEDKKGARIWPSSNEPRSL